MRHFPYAGLIVALALAGCARIDTGQIDYRIAEPRPDKAAENTTGPLLPAKVYRRYLQPDGDEQKPFVKDEVFSIEIEQGMIGENILEGEPFDAIFKMTGEVAILTNVFEFAGSERMRQRPASSRPVS